MAALSEVLRKWQKYMERYLKAGDSEFCYEFDHFCVVVDFHQLTKLVVGLEPSQQTTELVVVACIR